MSRFTLLSFIAALVLGSGFLFTLNHGSHAMPQRFPIASTSQLASAVDALQLYLPTIIREAPLDTVDTRDSWGKGCGGGSIEVYGRIINVTSRPVYSVTLQVKAYDAEHQLLTSSKPVAPLLPATLPGQPNPFHVQIDLDPCLVPHPLDYKVVFNTWTTHSPFSYVELSVLSKVPPATGPFSCGACNVTITGEVRNDSPYTVDEVRVVVEDPHSQAQEQLGFAKLGKDVLAPGETTTYSVDFSYYFVDICNPRFDPVPWPDCYLDRVKVYGQGRLKP